MAVLPPGSCGLCRTVKNTVKFINKNMYKHVMIYAFFYLLLFEGLSLLLRDREDYSLYWYPLLTQFALTVIFYNLYLFRNRLRFCLRKKIAVASLTAYYGLGVLTMIFQICNTVYLQFINHLLLLVTMFTLLLTIVQKKK